MTRGAHVGRPLGNLKTYDTADQFLGLAHLRRIYHVGARLSLDRDNGVTVVVTSWEAMAPWMQVHWELEDPPLQSHKRLAPPCTTSGVSFVCLQWLLLLIKTGMGPCDFPHFLDCSFAFKSP